MPLNIGLTCYPSVGGSGILATNLGEELSRRGHEVHFISYERPFRLQADAPGLHFHRVIVNDYDLFKYPDYTLPLSVKMAEVSRDLKLDVLHVHYAVPHSTAALLARSMLPPKAWPKVITTLHGTDATLLGHDAGYRPAIRHALNCSDAVTAVSAFLQGEARRLLGLEKPVEVIHNFFSPRRAVRTPEQVRAELGLRDEALILHSSNLRPIKRIDVLLETAARVRGRVRFKLLILAGGDFAPFADEVQRLGLSDIVLVRERVSDIEDYLQTADVALFTSDMESFCLGILEAMTFGRPSVATRVGGIPEVIEDGISGMLAPAGDADALASAVRSLLENPERRRKLGEAGRRRARERFSAEAVVPRYEALYRRVCDGQGEPQTDTD